MKRPLDKFGVRQGSQTSDIFQPLAPVSISNTTPTVVTAPIFASYGQGSGLLRFSGFIRASSIIELVPKFKIEIIDIWLRANGAAPGAGEGVVITKVNNTLGTSVILTTLQFTAGTPSECKRFVSSFPVNAVQANFVINPAIGDIIRVQDAGAAGIVGGASVNLIIVRVP